METKKRTIPLLPLRGILVFPYMIIHLDVGREKSISALEEAMVDDRLIMLAAQKDAQNDNPEPDDIFTVGTVAEIKQLLKQPAVLCARQVRQDKFFKTTAYWAVVLY